MDMKLRILILAAHTVSLTWNVTPSETYNFYRSKMGEKYVRRAAALKLPKVEDKDVLPGDVYCYYVTAVDSQGRESQPSAAVCVTIPTP
jgi:fibronectin type 3 domain-containing protein